MPEIEDEFKFPDEVDEKEASSKVEIEIEDDTPAEDRGREPMPKPILEELEKDELDAYDGAAKEKLKQMRKVWHDERRAKEAADRERQEAVAFAQKLMNENKRIKEILSTGEKEYVSTVQNAANLELEMAKKAYREAYESGDTERLLDAQQAITQAQLHLERVNNFRLPALQEEEFKVQNVQRASEPDTKAVAWSRNNPWFGQDEEMTASALGLHEKLRRQGVAVGSDDYYAKIDESMRKRFPESFDEVEVRVADTPKKTSVVAPATRSTSPKKVKLKTSQVVIAKKLGLTPEQYVKELLKLEQ